MIGLVLVTHGRLAAEFVTAMEHVVGPQEAIEAICIGPDDDMEARRKDIAEAIAKVDQGQGVIILTDLFGGTPSNLAISLMKSENIEVIAGVNLPMLIRLEGARKVMPVHAAVAAAREAGRKYISVASRDPRGGRGLTARQPRGPDHQQARAPCPGQRQVRQSRQRARRQDRGREGRQPGLRHLDHGPDDARRGDGRQIVIHVEGDDAEEALGQAGRAGRGAVRRRMMPREVTAFSNTTVKLLRSLRDKKARRAEGLFLAEGLRILAEARDSGRLPEIIAFSPKGRRHPLAAEIIAATEAAGGDAIETTPDILSKMSGKDNPQMLLGAYRQPDTALERIDRDAAPLWIVAQALRDPGNIGTILQDRRRGRRRRADPDRRLRRPFLGRGGARVDGRDVHAGGRDRALGRVRRLAARRAQGQLVGTSLKATHDYLEAEYRPALLPADRQ